MSRADLVYANLEGLLVPSLGPDNDLPDKSGWQHPGPESVPALKAGNVSVVGGANNVAFGHQNILKSLAVLDANGISHTGLGANLQAAHKPAIVERKGVKFGFLQYSARWYDASEQVATATAPGVARLLSQDGVTIDPSDLARIKEDIRKLRSQVDIVVVSSHNRDGGTEGQLAEWGQHASSSPEGKDHTHAEGYEKQFAHVAIDSGADIVFGHGSHVLQGVEVYQGKAILYCLGQFASDWIKVRKAKDGLVVRMVVQGKQLQRVSFVPVTRDDEFNNVTMLDPATGLGAQMLQHVKDLSGSSLPPMKIEGKEVVLVENPVITSGK